MKLQKKQQEFSQHFYFELKNLCESQCMAHTYISFPDTQVCKYNIHTECSHLHNNAMIISSQLLQANIGIL